MCKLIYYKDGDQYNASGFFCKLNINENKKLFLMTNNHCLDKDYLNSNSD